MPHLLLSLIIGASFARAECLLYFFGLQAKWYLSDSALTASWLIAARVDGVALLIESCSQKLVLQIGSAASVNLKESKP